MLIFCCLIKSSSKSSGPSYIGICIRYPAPELSLFVGLAILPLTPSLAGSRLAARHVVALLFPPEDRLAHPLHGLLRLRARLPRTFVNHPQHRRRVSLIFEPPRANRRDPSDQIVRHRALAFDAPDARAPAPRRRPLERRFAFRGIVSRGVPWRKQFVPIIHGANVRISRITAALSRRVRLHWPHFVPYTLVAFAQQDGVAIAFRHLSPIRAGNARRLRYQRGQECINVKTLNRLDTTKGRPRVQFGDALRTYFEA